MGGKGLNALDAAGRELTRALGQLDESNKFQVIVYHHKRDLFKKQGLVTATARHIEEMEQFFQRLAAFGGTNHGDAVLAGLRAHPDVLFLLTDGAVPPIKDRELKDIRRRAAGRTAIHCIQFGNQPLEKRLAYMQRLTMENNGSYSYVQMGP